MNLILKIFIASSILVKKRYAVPIIGGEPAPELYFTYQALVYAETGDRVSKCSGAIIDSAHVLTAGHCVTKTSPKFLTVIAGVTSRRDPNGFYYSVKEVHTPEGYPGVRQVTTAYDIAVVVINGLFDDHPSITEIPLPRAPAQPGEECIYSGWGDTDDDGSSPDHLQWATGTILTHDICRGFSDIHRSYEFCFIHDKYASTIHDGDSGAPFVCNGVLTGIITRGGGDLRITSTGVDVFRFYEFIRGILDKFVCDLSYEGVLQQIQDS